MPKASEIAAELRRIADSFDQEPDTVLKSPMLSFYCEEKDHFLATTRLLPRPLAKLDNKSQYEIEVKGGSRNPIWFRSKIDRSKICKLVTPAQDAVYECVPLLSHEEEAALDNSSPDTLLERAERLESL